MARPVSYDNLNVGTKATSAEIAAWENNIYTAFFMVFDNWKSPVCVTPEAQVPLTLESKFRMTPIKS